jgi:hypothetical protein
VYDALFGFGAHAVVTHEGGVAGPCSEAVLTDGVGLEGKLVLVSRGGSSCVEKARRVVVAGGVAMIMVNRVQDRFAPTGSGIEQKPV